MRTIYYYGRGMFCLFCSWLLLCTYNDLLWLWVSRMIKTCPGSSWFNPQKISRLAKLLVLSIELLARERRWSHRLEVHAL